MTRCTICSDTKYLSLGWYQCPYCGVEFCPPCVNGEALQPWYYEEKVMEYQDNACLQAKVCPICGIRLEKE